MWVFLVTEVLFFGGMFMAYILYRMWYPDAWMAGEPPPRHRAGRVQHGRADRQLADDGAGGAGGADRASASAQVMFLVLTIVLGAVFLGVKVVEYADKFEHHLVPGPNFLFDDPRYAAARRRSSSRSTSR